MKLTLASALFVIVTLNSEASAAQSWYLQMKGGGFNSAVAYQFTSRGKCERLKRSLIGNIKSVTPKPKGTCSQSMPKGTTVVLTYR